MSWTLSQKKQQYHHKESVINIIEECRKYKIKIVAGGPLFTQEYKNYPQIDHFILNEFPGITGCPFQCDFCEITTLLGHKVRMTNVFFLSYLLVPQSLRHPVSPSPILPLSM